jgi:hypothetical protein
MKGDHEQWVKKQLGAVDQPQLSSISEELHSSLLPVNHRGLSFI